MHVCVERRETIQCVWQQTNFPSFGLIHDMGKDMQVLVVFMDSAALS